MRPALEGLIKELDLQDRVRMVGFVQDLSALQRGSDIFLHSSIYEGLCRSVLEAMAAGLVVVATDVGGIRQYGVDGQNMIKAGGTDRAALAAALIRALEMGPDARRLQIGALRTIAQDFSPDRLREHWNAALAGIAPEGGPC